MHCRYQKISLWAYDGSVGTARTYFPVDVRRFERCRWILGRYLQGYYGWEIVVSRLQVVGVGYQCVRMLPCDVFFFWYVLYARRLTPTFTLLSILHPISHLLYPASPRVALNRNSHSPIYSILNPLIRPHNSINPRRFAMAKMLTQRNRGCGVFVARLFHLQI